MTILPTPVAGGPLKPRHRSSSAAQLTLAFRCWISASCLLMATAPLGLLGSRGFYVLCLFYIADITPATAKPARGKGVRSTGARCATDPCGASGVRGSSAYFRPLPYGHPRLTAPRVRHLEG